MPLKPNKILYVDDQAMALKYFERLVSPIAPVLTASSVGEGEALLRAQSAEIAVVVSDQRMPGAQGNELLRYAREQHPHIVRMLTTAYSELSEAIEAINTGEIYRYVTKPWNMTALQADLRSALELAQLRFERNELMREKLWLQQQQLLSTRLTQLHLACAALIDADCSLAVHQWVQCVVHAGWPAPVMDWRAIDHADLMQIETERSLQTGRQIQQMHQDLCKNLGARPDPQTLLHQGLQALAQLLSGRGRLHEQGFLFDHASNVGLFFSQTSKTPVADADVALLAWLLWSQTPIECQKQGDGLYVQANVSGTGSRLSNYWMAADIDALCEVAVS